MPYQTATNPKTGEKVVLVGDEWKPYTQTATGPKGAKAYLVGSEWMTESQAPPSYLEKVTAGVTDFAREVINPVIGPYVTAAGVGAATGAPFAGVGAAPGAAFGVAAMTKTTKHFICHTRACQERGCAMPCRGCH